MFWYLSLVVLLSSVCQKSKAWIPSLVGKRSSYLNAAINNNIVLRPSESPEAFDSMKIGSPRVHRYLRDGSTSEEASAEYVMWFHGRSKAIDEDKSLPPLSTGRIGRAVSLNGLQWEKVKEGSLAEDVSDVSLGLNQESWWGFDTSHVGLGQVLLPMSTPAISAEGGVYIMYYMGGNFEESPVTDFLDNVPVGAEKARFKGMKMRIGVAVSQDGITWGRVEGDDPTGACLTPYDKQDPNQKYMASMRDDDDSVLNIEEELYCAWPDVAVRIPDEDEEETTMGKKKPSFFMYYSTMRKSDKAKCIACAVSNDGFRWLKRGVVIEPDSSGLDAAGCARCNVFQNASYSDGVWRNEEGWVMLYEGVSKEDGKHRIMKAESADGRRWEKRGVALDVGDGEDAWDFGGVGSPHVLRLDDGSMRLYYTGQGTDGSTAIGVARVSNGADITTFSREQAEFAFS